MKSSGNTASDRSVFILGSAVVALLGFLCSIFAAHSETLPILLFYFFSGSLLLALWNRRRTSHRGLDCLMPVQVLLFVGGAQKFLYLIDLMYNGPRLESWPLEVADPARDWIIGEILTTCGTLITCFFLAQYEACISKLSIGVGSLISGIRRVSALYVASLACVFAFFYFSDFAFSFGQVLITGLEIGLVCCAVIPSVITGKYLAMVAAAALAFPFAYTSLGSGMKEAMVFSVLPLAIWAWKASTNTIGKVICVILGAILIGLISSYVAYFRGQVWYEKQQGSATDIMESFAADTRSYGLYQQLEDGMLAFLVRNHSARYRGWAVSAVELYGTQPQMIFLPLSYVFIPRVIWHEKPQIQQGNQYNQLIFGEKAALTGSSLSAGLYTSFYLGWGWIGFLLGAWGVAWVLGNSFLWSEKLGGPFLSCLLILSSVPSLLRNDEGWSVGALSGPIIQFLVIYGLYFIITRVLLLEASRQRA